MICDWQVEQARQCQLNRSSCIHYSKRYLNSKRFLAHEANIHGNVSFDCHRCNCKQLTVVTWKNSEPILTVTGMYVLNLVIRYALVIVIPISFSTSSIIVCTINIGWLKINIYGITVQKSNLRVSLGKRISDKEM